MSLETLEREYQENAGLYEALCTEIVTQLEELLREQHITLASPIESRVKTWRSIAEKVERLQFRAATLSEMRDVAGIRIIALFRRDIKPIERIIEANFEVLDKDDAFTRLTENQFGYGSIHYEVKTPAAWLKVPTLKKLEGLRAEIQVRTGSQHIWAAASHILQYKRETHVPGPLLRTINRVAALLETVDLEFERVLVERAEYAREISKAKEDISLNIESLRRLLDSQWPVKNRDEDEDYAALLDEVLHFNIKTTDQLKAIIEKHKQAAFQDEKSQVTRWTQALSKGEEVLGTSEARTRAGVFFTHSGLTRAALDEELGREYLAYRIEKYKTRKTPA